MLWKILLLALCALAAWAVTRPRADRGASGNGEDDGAQNLALCPKCGVYHRPDAPCRSGGDAGAAAS